MFSVALNVTPAVLKMYLSYTSHYKPKRISGISHSRESQGTWHSVSHILYKYTVLTSRLTMHIYQILVSVNIKGAIKYIRLKENRCCTLKQCCNNYLHFYFILNLWSSVPHMPSCGIDSSLVVLRGQQILHPDVLF